MNDTEAATVPDTDLQILSVRVMTADGREAELTPSGQRGVIPGGSSWDGTISFGYELIAAFDVVREFVWGRCNDNTTRSHNE